MDRAGEGCAGEEGVVMGYEVRGRICVCVLCACEPHAYTRLFRLSLYIHMVLVGAKLLPARRRARGHANLWTPGRLQDRL